MIRYADVKDLKEILEIVSDAKGFLKENGVDQWQGDYPNADVFIKDIKSNNLYVYEREEVMGFASIIFGNDITYNKIYEGKWLSNESYITIHRLAVKNKYKRASVATKLIEYASLLAKSKNIKSIRIDTHKDNIPMQKMIEKNGFIRCGIIYLLDGNERIAYERII